MIVAHGNSLRGLAMMLLHLTAEDVVSLEIPTGSPWMLGVDDRINVVNQYYLTRKEMGCFNAEIGN